MTDRNEQILITFTRRPDFRDGPNREFKELLRCFSFHVPRVGDVITMSEEVYVVHEVAWQCDNKRINSVQVYLRYEGEL